MGRGFTQFSYPDSDTEDEFALYSAFLDYEMSDGTLLHVHQTEAWCPDCDCILMAEHVQSIEELQSELDRLLNPDEEELFFIQFIGTPIEDRIVEAERRIQWRRSRTSPAKCLQCGSTQIVALPAQEEFTHPKTGERVKVSGHGFASTTIWEARFTTEGEKIWSRET